jgi:hypothetical protein
VVGVYYKRPAAEAKEIEELFKVLQMAAKGEVLIMGDFNYPGINWETFESNNHGQVFRDLVMENFLIQHMREPTKWWKIWTFCSICWNLICDIKQVVIETRHRRYQKGNYILMREDFQKIKWEEEFKGMDVENI